MHKSCSLNYNATMIRQENLIVAARHFYGEIQVDDRNLRLSGDSGVVDHHFGVGKFDLSMLDEMTQAEISLAIRNLENNQARMLIEMMGEVQPHHRVLDAGCGRGGTALRLHEDKGCKIEGITIAGYQAKFANEVTARRGFQSGIHFKEMDMLNLGYPENSFDHVFTNETTMYVVNLRQLFAEFRRVLKEGGKYTLATWCINQDYGPDNPYVEPINKHYGVVMHTEAEYKQALTGAGFEIIDDRDLTDLVIPHWELRSRWEEASGVESHYLEGHKNRAILYKMVSATLAAQNL